MPNVAAGTTASYTFTSRQTIGFTTDPGESLTYQVLRAGATIASGRATSDSSIGPFLTGDVLSVTAQRGAVDYTIVEAPLSASVIGLPSTWEVDGQQVYAGRVSGVPAMGSFDAQTVGNGPAISMTCVSQSPPDGHATFNFRRSRGSAGALTAVQTGDEYGAIACRAHNGTDFEGHSGSLAWYASENHTLAANGTSASFFTVRNGTVGSSLAWEVLGNGQFVIRGGAAVYGGAVENYRETPAGSVLTENAFGCQIYTAAGAYTLANVRNYISRNVIKGSGSAVTNLSGFYCEELTAGANTNIGFRSVITSGAGKYNMFMDGTAQNYIEGNTGLGTNAPTEKLDVNSNTIRLRTARTPATSSDTGTAGSICWDSLYIYVCVATNTWKRVLLLSW